MDLRDESWEEILTSAKVTTDSTKLLIATAMGVLRFRISTGTTGYSTIFNSQTRKKEKTTPDATKRPMTSGQDQVGEPVVELVTSETAVRAKPIQLARRMQPGRSIRRMIPRKVWGLSAWAGEV